MSETEEEKKRLTGESLRETERERGLG